MKKEKKDLREHFKKIREHISLYRRREASDDCFSFLMANLPEKSKVLSFASTKDELDIWPINEILMQQERLFLPRASDNKVEFYLVSSLLQLVSSKYSILEPDPSITGQASFLEIDVILVPGLCFDANNSRVGYGSGYYDKLIHAAKKQNPSISFWGIGYLEQYSSVDLLQDKTDISLDQIFLF